MKRTTTAQGRRFIAWVKAYIECLREGRPCCLLDPHEEVQKLLFK